MLKEARTSTADELKREMEQRPIVSTISQIGGGLVTGGAGATTKPEWLLAICFGLATSRRVWVKVSLLVPHPAQCMVQAPPRTGTALKVLSRVPWPVVLWVGLFQSLRLLGVFSFTP